MNIEAVPRVWVFHMTQEELCQLASEWPQVALSAWKVRGVLEADRIEVALLEVESLSECTTRL